MSTRPSQKKRSTYIIVDKWSRTMNEVVKNTLAYNSKVGPYQIRQFLGLGPAGEVYKAFHTMTGQVVALKILPTAITKDTSLLRRLQEELQIYRTLEHPNVVQLLSFGRDDKYKKYYIAMEFVDGAHLGIRFAKKSFPMAKIIDFFEQILSGLAAAHNLNIIHCDLRLQNIFLTKSEEVVKIVNFGMVEVIENQKLPNLEYVAPELTAKGLDQRPPSTLTDIYSAGIVLKNMLKTLRSQINPDLEALLIKMIERDPLHRYKAVGDILRDLQPFKEMKRKRRFFF